MMYFHAEDEMIRIARDFQNRIDNGYKYYCDWCDWYFKADDVEEQTDGISDTPCPDCNSPLQTELDTDYHGEGVA